MFKCSLVWLPFKTWNSDNLSCFNFKKRKGEMEQKQRASPASRPEPSAHRGVLWGTISDRENQKKAKQMGSERWTRVYRLQQAWHHFSPLREPSTTVLMNVKWRGPPLMLRSASGRWQALGLHKTTVNLAAAVALTQERGARSRLFDKAQRWSSC